MTTWLTRFSIAAALVVGLFGSATASTVSSGDDQPSEVVSYTLPTTNSGWDRLAA